jgi:hypothetical protein
MPKTLDDEICPPCFLITNPGFVPKPLPSLHLAGNNSATTLEFLLHR